jgi:hypothetical protein
MTGADFAIIFGLGVVAGLGLAIIIGALAELSGRYYWYGGRLWRI